MIGSLLLNSLKRPQTNSLARNISKRRKRLHNWRRNKGNYDANTHMYSGYQLKKFDYMSEDLEFPIKVPIVRKAMFKVKRSNFQKNTPTDPNFRFDGMTGNEILLALMDCKYMNQTELVRGIVALSNIDDALKIDWNDHEIMLDCLDLIFEMKDELTLDSYLDLLKTLTKLKIYDQEIFEMFYELFEKFHPRLKGENFGMCYKIFMDKDYISDENKKWLTDLLPRELEKMEPLTIVTCFE